MTNTVFYGDSYSQIQFNMMEEPKQLQECSTQTVDNDRKDLEEKIKQMWKTIEDLKQKVTEERELLKKEKSENERMIEEQIMLHRKLSMFHLPHCPAYAAHPPCPVHSFMSQPVTPTGLGLDGHSVDQQESLFHGDHELLHSYEDLLRGLHFQNRGACEDLFEDCSPTAPDNTHASDFTLLLSEQWRDRKQAANTRQETSVKPQPCYQCQHTMQVANAGEEEAVAEPHLCYQAQGKSSTFQFGEAQLSEPSEMCSNNIK